MFAPLFNHFCQGVKSRHPIPGQCLRNWLAPQNLGSVSWPDPRIGTWPPPRNLITASGPDHRLGTWPPPRDLTTASGPDHRLGTSSLPRDLTSHSAPDQRLFINFSALDARKMLSGCWVPALSPLIFVRRQRFSLFIATRELLLILNAV
jgi:hypothetical protein